ncbi:MAG TPA: alpha/beta fold hydrolase [Bryobacteraceae bacterium]|nr:alpha/beta fold hydrolase [Bryobacteraceae bacterium]
MKLITTLLLATALSGVQDLRLTYRSEIDQTDQPYRILVPAAYDGTRPFPLVFALHGTGGTEATMIDGPQYGKGALKRAAERSGALIVSPFGRGVTEFRGIGENDILSVLADVRRRYRVDPDRIYLTGHSMGGTGSAYLAMRHPDVFAAAAPLAAAYSFPWLAANLKQVPSWWIMGAADDHYYHLGVDPGIARLRALGCPVRYTNLPGKGHGGPVEDLEGVVAWLLEHKRAHPREYVFEVDTPMHGRAWWTSVEAITEPGKMAMVKARAEGRGRARLELTNVAALAFVPDPDVFDAAIEVTVDGTRVYNGRLSETQELGITGGPRRWKAAPRPRRERSLTAWRTNPVAEAPERLDMRGIEAPLANWITDAMRAATGADLALYNRQHYRGLPLPAGTVDMVDLIQASRPFDQYLVTVRLRGRDLVEIFDANIPQPKKPDGRAVDAPVADRLVQLSGGRYTFDRSRPAGSRIVETDLVPDRVYTVALEGQVVERETMLLAGRFGKLDFRTTDVPFTLALYGHAAKQKRIVGRVEGRVRER